MRMLLLSGPPWPRLVEGRALSVTAITAALAAACSFATAAILQQEAARTIEASESLRLRLLADLLRRPRWVAGVSMLVIGFVLQAVALGHGPVALVQPIVATELAFAIPMATLRRRHRPRWRDWGGIALVLGGVSAFLVAASPAPGTAQAALGEWLATLLPVGAVALGAVALARPSRGPRRASLLGAAAGLSFALLAVLTKSVVHQLGQSAAAAFSSWQIYLVLAIGISALVISQSAYQAGPLALSMPAIATVEPVVAVVIGDTLFNEQARLGGLALAVEAAAALAALAGLLVLATSPTVLSIYGQDRPEDS